MRRNELRMYRTAVLAAIKLDKVSDAPWMPWTITADHATKRVRTNGKEALCTLIDLVQEGEEYLEQLAVHENAMAACRELVQKVLDELLGYFMLCPSCAGAKGAYDKEQAKSFGYGRGWEDCATCQGRGMLPRGETVWQDEGRTYTPPEHQLATRIDCWPGRREAA